jgi:hypothetical protein
MPQAIMSVTMIFVEALNIFFLLFTMLVVIIRHQAEYRILYRARSAQAPDQAIRSNSSTPAGACEILASIPCVFGCWKFLQQNSKFVRKPNM